MERIAYSYGCLMAMFPEPLADRVRGFADLIPDEDVFDDADGESGREDEPHVTVLYGFHEDNSAVVAQAFSGQSGAVVTLGEISAFHNDDNIVLKIDVNSPDLARLNSFARENFEVTSQFPEYHPHVTIAYLRHRKDDPYYYHKYFCSMFSGTEVAFDQLVFSSSDGKRGSVVLLPETPTRRAARIALRVARRFLSKRKPKKMRKRRKPQQGEEKQESRKYYQKNRAEVKKKQKQYRRKTESR